MYVLGRQLAALDGAEAGYCTASGLGAISTALLGLLDQGDHVIASDTLYGGTRAMLAEFFPKKCGITTTFVDTNDHDAVDRAFTPRTKVVYTESLSNPTLRVSNLPMLADLAHGHGAQLVVDNTFTPLAITPMDHGADVVVHSLTKFVNGASDFIAGAVCGRSDFVASLMDLHMGPLMILGPTMDPQVAHAISLRMPHLPIRMIEHARRAMEFAQRLSDKGVLVQYPGLSNHPDHTLFKSIGRPEYGFGGLLTIDAGSREKAERSWMTYRIMKDLVSCREPWLLRYPDVLLRQLYVQRNDRRGVACCWDCPGTRTDVHRLHGKFGAALAAARASLEPVWFSVELTKPRTLVRVGAP